MTFSRSCCAALLYCVVLDYSTSDLILGQEKKQINSPEAKGQSVLAVGAMIGDQKYCVGDAEIGFIKLALKISFTNISRDVVILNRGSGTVSRVLVARSIAEMRARQFEADMSISSMVGHYPDEPRRSLADLTVRLRPGESHSVTTQTRIPYLISGTEPHILGIRRGETYFVSFVISTWPEESLTPESAEKAFAGIGRVWSSNVQSNPISLDLPQKPIPSSCD
jgi:hypothetical protein